MNMTDNKIISDSQVLTFMKKDTSFAKVDFTLKTVKNIDLIRKVYMGYYDLDIEDLLNVLEEMDYLLINNEISTNVKTVLYLKFDVEIDGYQELDEVIKSGNFDIIKFLSYENYDIKKCILLAIEGAQYEIVKGVQFKLMLFFMNMVKEFSMKDNFDFLKEASKYGNKEIVEYLLRYNKIIKTDKNVRYLVHNSLKNGNYNSFKILVDFYNYDYSDAFNDSNIDCALKGGNSDLIDEIISVSNLTSIFQITIMSLEYDNSSFRYLFNKYEFTDDEIKQIFAKSIGNNNNYAIEIFHNVIFNDTNYMSYVAKIALKNNKIDVFNKLVDVGIDFLNESEYDQYNNNDYKYRREIEDKSFLIHAISGNTDIEVVKFVLSNIGGNIGLLENDFDKTIKSAIKRGNLDILKILLPEEYEPNNYSFLNLSIIYKRYDIVEFLLAQYHCFCDLTCIEDVEQLSEVIYFSGEFEKDIKTMNLFIEYVNTENEMLLVSIFKNRFDLVNYFLNMGVNLNDTSCEYLPLSMVIDLTHFEFVDFDVLDTFRSLIELGSNFDLTGKSFCDFGYEQFNEEFAKYVLSIGVKITIFDLKEINEQIIRSKNYRPYRFLNENFVNILKIITENVQYSKDKTEQKNHLINDITRNIKRIKK